MNERLNHKSIGVVGLGMSNAAVVDYLLKHDLKKLTVFDTRANPPYVDEMPGGIDLRLGPLDADEMCSYDILVVSPGLPLYLPPLAAAASNGVQLVGDVELFAFEAKAPVIGITGSNGKSTVTALVGFMAEQAGLTVAVGANFGRPVFDILSDKVDLYVLELSSFELETTRSLQLAAGVILNISEDHLDRYDGSMTLYAEAKYRIFNHCSSIIVNRDDPATFPRNGRYNASFGLDNQSYGRLKEGDSTFLTINGKKVFDVKDLRITGRHNELNALAAMALCDSVNIPRQAQIKALKMFSGLEHRCQLVRTLNGVSFFNDSKATNVASAQAAIEGLSEKFPKGIILLAGGIGKGQDFTPLKKYLGHEVCAMYCYGRDSRELLALSDTLCHSTLNLRQALNEAFAQAQEGQAILLSPACASFDQFKGYEERGRIFCNLVNHLEVKG